MTDRLVCKHNLLVQERAAKSTIQLLTLCDEEVEHGQYHRVTAEHVVAARVHSRQGHPETAPDGHGSLQFGPHVTVDLEEEGGKKRRTGCHHAPCRLKNRQRAPPTFPEHCRCCPGTDREVTNMVTQRSMKTVPIRLHIRRRRMDLQVGWCIIAPGGVRRHPRERLYLCLWSSSTNNQMLQRMTPHASAIAKAHGILGTLWERRRNTRCQF